MNTHRVTLRAFGTTGVLVAASLAMLATVSALVAFDGWPRGYGSSSVDNVSVTGGAMPSALVVRAAPAQTALGAAVANAGTPAPAGFVKASGAPAATGFAAGFVKSIGPVGPGYGPIAFNNSGPIVGPLPTGCGAACNPPTTQQQTGIVGQIQHTACGAAGSVCGATPHPLDVTELPAPVGTPPAGLPRAELPQIHVQAPVQAPAQVPHLPGG